MKFRAVMRNLQHMQEFQNMIQTLSKLCKECVLQITAQKLQFIANEESGSAAPLVWLVIDAQYFEKYNMQGVAAEYPDIWLSLSAVNLARALSTQRQQVKELMLTLANVQFPCLIVSTETSTQTSSTARRITHHVPVSVIPRKDWLLYALPQVPSCKLVLNVPANRLIRGLIERLKNLSHSLVFYATSQGEMSLVAETDMATITTRYCNLEVCAQNPSETDRGKEQIEASCSVDCKKAALFFSTLQVPSLELSCGIADDHLIHMEVNVRDGMAIHSILPALCV